MRIRNENLIAMGEQQEPLSALEQLEQLIPAYALNKSELDGYKKLCDTENSTIKKLMADLNISEKIVGGYIAKKTVSNRETINEEMLLNVAHQFGIPEIIKTKEYIDYDALELAIYNEKIPTEVLWEINKCKESKTVVTLKVSKVKKKKEEED